MRLRATWREVARSCRWRQRPGDDGGSAMLAAVCGGLPHVRERRGGGDGAARRRGRARAPCGGCVRHRLQSWRASRASVGGESSTRVRTAGRHPRRRPHRFLSGPFATSCSQTSAPTWCASSIHPGESKAGSSKLTRAEGVRVGDQPRQARARESTSTPEGVATVLELVSRGRMW